MSASSVVPPLRLATPSRASIKDGLGAARAGDRRATLEIALQQVILGLVPMIVVAALLDSVLVHHTDAVDFRNAYYVAAYRLLHGGDPYAWTSAGLRDGVAFVYPALSAIVFVPFALLSVAAASVIFTLICIALTPLTLWVLRVRDWRVYGVTLLWLPVFGAWQTGNETILLTLMAALAWRYRERPLVAGLLTAAAISMKPFMWPLGLWLLATRRWRAAGYAFGSGLLINLVSWAVLGFGNISVYLHDSSLDTGFAWRAGYSVVALAAHLGATHAVGDVLTVLVCLALIAGILYAGLFRHRERQALTLSVALMLAASPLVWSHYFALLLIPMAIERPRLGWLWALPLLMWVCPPSFHVAGWQEAVAWLVAGTMLVTLTRRARA